jgi:hypothetical protein
MQLVHQIPTTSLKTQPESRVDAFYANYPVPSNFKRTYLSHDSYGLFTKHNFISTILHQKFIQLTIGHADRIARRIRF